MKFICLIIIFFSLSNGYGKEADFAITPLHFQAYHLITSLQFEKGDLIIKKVKTDYTENLLIYHIENYRDIIEILISEDVLIYERLKGNKMLRLEKLKSGNPQSPYFLFSQAEVIIHWAMVSLKFGKYYDAAIELNRAIGMLEKNKALFPDFLPNNKSLSFIHAAIGTVPNFYKNLLSLVSNFNGSIEQGLSEINKILEKTSPESDLFYSEAIAIKALILIHFENKKEEAWQLLNTSNLDHIENPLLTFLFANTANHAGHNDLAIKILESRVKSPRFQYFPHLDYLLGNAKLHRLDSDADLYLQTYTKHFKGGSYIKDAYKKMAWSQLIIHNNSESYHFYMEQCIALGNDGNEVDKSALYEAKNNVVPHKLLLKARLLFDGGYYKKAVAKVEEIDTQLLSSSETMEFYYRSGRIQQALQNDEVAIRFYQRCLTHELSENSFFACNAALQMGFIYENIDAQKAGIFFKKCISMNPSQYKNSLHQKAKAGLQRVK